MSTDTTRPGRRLRRWFTGRTKLSLLAVTVVAAVAVPVGFAVAEPETRAVNFEVPFGCGQSWEGQTRTNHNPQNSIDFNRAGDDGDAVASSAAGTVATVRDLGGSSYGKYVVVSHGSGWQTLYAHLKSFSVKVGQKVNTGSKIGTVGSTGGSTGPHLHYEQKLNGSAVKIKFDGKGAYYWGSRTYKSSNNCGGNPYSAEQVCGSGYKQVDSKAINAGGKRQGTVYLLYNASKGNNCVATMKAVSLGKKTATSAFLEVKGSKKVTDSGNFAYYSGPVRKYAKGTCVKWGGSVGSTTVNSGDWSHCG
ncbi:M23 family metallopeptidase [Stackebrandtia nassauensis]|uniref:Peptidase M23 n=1 Tax=Stackebrandtia nassauensis (strain DSM 44728 / CIP 108903 / NRRL B-16338 / NBRC 102104 / LLR-40K-21) TaxID=446470 RepID=D3QAJ5_STANL|nr:M23 family metallopeptidase [Stackebrandtia nassauensis]ADD42778.1 Peptidase M23 [Stackebrandtia nassauensis DSM 44728]